MAASSTAIMTAFFQKVAVVSELRRLYVCGKRSSVDSRTCRATATLRLADSALDLPHEHAPFAFAAVMGHTGQLPGFAQLGTDSLAYQTGDRAEGPWKTHHRAVQHGKDQDGDTGEDDVVGGRGDAVDQGLAAEAVVELVVEQHKAEDDVLVEGVLDQPAQAVAGQGAVHQQQPHLHPAHAASRGTH